jgi:serine/threonine-protein kinase
VITPKPAPVVPEPATIPPISTRMISAHRDPGPAIESNTKAEPSMTPPVVASSSATSPSVGRVGLAISPWGEVYVDGRMRGVTPPLTELKLPPGTYTVEIRNTTFAPLRQTIEVGPDASLRIRHKFR